MQALPIVIEQVRQIRLLIRRQRRLTVQERGQAPALGGIGLRRDLPGSPCWCTRQKLPSLAVSGKRLAPL